MDDLKMLTLATATMPWEDLTNPVTGKIFHRKLLMEDSETGTTIMLVRYPAGTVTPWHRHSCAHGLYVLEGQLHTHEGPRGPGDFVWYPEGNIGEHGALTEEPVTLLFVTNKAFNIEFVPEGPGA